jgi:hypothetical protein
MVIVSDKMSEPRIVSNRIRTPDGTILESMHRHDYVTYLDANGLEYMVDGGLDYLRRNVHDDAPHEEWSVYSDDPHDVIREVFKWGTRGKDGRQPLTYVPLKDLTTDHIVAILETQDHIQQYIRNIFLDEMIFRTKNV